MGKYCGIIGYSVTEETKPGVWTERITERKTFGDVIRNTSRRYENGGQQVNENIVISNSLSIVADPFAYENFAHIKYAELMGTKWIVTNVEVQYPRLLLTLGGVYNG